VKYKPVNLKKPCLILKIQSILSVAYLFSKYILNTAGYNTRMYKKAKTTSAPIEGKKGLDLYAPQKINFDHLSGKRTIDTGRPQRPDLRQNHHYHRAQAGIHPERGPDHGDR
jgi:hypothetical protein